MKAIALDKKNIAFLDGDERLATLLYVKRMSFRAFIRLSGGLEYEIIPLNFWKTRFEILENGKTIVEFQRKLTGKVLIQVIRSGHRQSFIFRPGGLFDNRFVLMDKDKREISVIRTKFLWKGFKYEYNLLVSDSLKRCEDWLLLVILQTYLSRYILRQHRKGHRL